MKLTLNKHEANELNQFSNLLQNKGFTSYYTTDFRLERERVRGVAGEGVAGPEEIKNLHIPIYNYRICKNNWSNHILTLAHQHNDYQCNSKSHNEV